MTMAAAMPAKTSSQIIQVYCFWLLAQEMGQGFTISKKRNNIKDKIHHNGLKGATMMGISCPTASSATNQAGSWVGISWDILQAAIKLVKKIIVNKGASMVMLSVRVIRLPATMVVTRLAQVQGALGQYPMPPQVAMRKAVLRFIMG
jgi:hypothetical protein